MSKRIYIICPVRKVTEEQKIEIEKHVDRLEKQGHIVHYPPVDVDQSQRSIDICTEHAKAMLVADEVHIALDNTSRGSIWDAGMAYVLHILALARTGKGLVFKMVPGFVIEPTEHKSYENVLLELCSGVVPGRLP